MEKTGTLAAKDGLDPLHLGPLTSMTDEECGRIIGGEGTSTSTSTADFSNEPITIEVPLPPDVNS